MMLIVIIKSNLEGSLFYNYIQRKIGEEEQKDPNSEVNKYPSKSIDKDYFYVTMSNAIDSPNNHIFG